MAYSTSVVYFFWWASIEVPIITATQSTNAVSMTMIHMNFSQPVMAIKPILKQVFGGQPDALTDVQDNGTRKRY